MAEEPTPPSPPACNFFRRPSSSTKNIRKRPAHHEEVVEEEEVEYQQNLSSHLKTMKHLSSSSSSFHFESSKEIQVHHDSGATASLETETPFDRDARAIRERVLRLSSDPSSRPSSDAKLYHGAHAYTDYTAGFRREHTVSCEKAGGAHGPLRASAHIRASARFDYQPDICKDYKATGYCGFGDACKFMHDRGDCKSGWQLEKEWEESENARKRGLAMRGKEAEGEDDEGGDNDEDDVDGLSFACFICRQPFEDPVVTKCKHYFCEHCALKHHSKNKKCFVCNQPTLGIFNTAHEIRKKMLSNKLVCA